MANRWLATCKVNMDASNYVNIVVKANTERKAKIMAVNKCYKEGYSNPEVIKCEEIKGEATHENS